MTEVPDDESRRGRRPGHQPHQAQTPASAHQRQMSALGTARQAGAVAFMRLASGRR